jgi:group I intron endonuclease
MDLEGSGIYEIRNLRNGKRYVGSAVRLMQRWAAHRSLLKKGTHHSDHLQKSWNLYGSESFEFSVLEYCRRDSLIEREQFHIDAGCDYNKAPIAGSPLGVKWSDEAREKASKRRSGIAKSSAHVESMRKASEKTWSNPKTRAKMAESIRRSYTPELREKRGEASRKNWQNPELAAQMSESIKRSYTPELRALRSAQNKARWNDPAFRDKMAQNRAKRSA